MAARRPPGRTAERDPIVGREPALSRIEAGLEELAAGFPVFLSVAGEPGIGKSRLLAELADRADERGYLVLAGSATEFERELPHGVWVNALDAYAASQAHRLEERWDAATIDELAAILPSVRGSGAAGGRSVSDERYRAHRAVRALLELLALTRPLVLVLDDLHWSDEASITLLAALLRRAPDAPVLLAAGFRPAQSPPRLAAAVAIDAVRKIELGHLSEGEAALLLGGLPARSVAALYRQGGGNPFYLQQLARAGGEGRRAEEGMTGSAATGGVPAAVAASLAEELASLSPGDRAFLHGAAAAGEPFDPDLAAAIAELPSAEGLDSLDALLARDIVRATDVPRLFEFRHPLVRRAVYESAPGGWRLAAHARAAAALAERGASVSERAHHVEQSAGQGDEAAIALLLAAGEAAAARAPAAAARWLRAALRLLPAGDAERQVAVRSALASALRSLGELDACRAMLLEALELLPAGATARHAELTASVAAVEHWLGRHSEAHARLARAWEQLPDGSTAESALLEIELAVDGLYELDLTTTIAMARRALATARALGEPSLVAAAAAALCLGETVAGNIEIARGCREEAVTAVDRLPDAELAPRLEALLYLAWAETYLEHYDAAVAHAARAIAIARSTGDGRLLAPLALVQNYPFEMQGRLAEGLEVCETCVEAARLSAIPHELYRALFEQGWTRYFAGDLEGAIAAYEECARVDPRLAGATIPNGGGGPGWGLGVALLESGEVERGRAILLELGGEDVARTMPVERCFDWESLALAELAVGNLDAAATYAERAEELAARLGLSLPAALAGRTSAAVLLARGEPLAAASAARRSAESADAIGARLQAAFSRSLEARALVAAGDREAAVALLRDVERELDACGSLRVRDEMRRELRRLGARHEARGPAAHGGSPYDELTKRELEIARLIFDRKTNREIATELFLSPKTVESHIRNVFLKLGVSSRVEVARTVERETRERGGPST
jgi:DNA-binding NarL/FixJ family response regulator